MILRIPLVRKCRTVHVAETGSCHVKRAAAKLTNREAAANCSLSLVSRKEVTESPHLFVEDEYAGLSGEADFLHLSAIGEKQRIIG